MFGICTHVFAVSMIAADSDQNDCDVNHIVCLSFQPSAFRRVSILPSFRLTDDRALLLWCGSTIVGGVAHLSDFQLLTLRPNNTHTTMRSLFVILLLLFSVAAQDHPASSMPNIRTRSHPPTPPATASPVTFVSSEAPRATAAPQSKRCDSPPCGGSGPTSVLTAQVVTSTLISTTSVPCYITTYVTDSTTVVSTVYSTAVQTSTVTEKNTVYIIKYVPTPVLRSTVLQTVVEITQTYTSMWLETTGSAYEVTTTGGMETVGGGTGGGGNGWSNGGMASINMPATTASGTQLQPMNSKDAWTHATATAAGATAGADMMAGNPAGAYAGATTMADGSVVYWNSARRLVAKQFLVIVLSLAIALPLVLW